MLKKSLKSRTMRFSALVAVLGVVETQFHLIQHLIPEEYRGLLLVAIGGAIAYYRVTTTTSLNDK